MKYLQILLSFLLATQLFSQQLLHKEPVAIPAPFELQKNISIEQIVQPLAKATTKGDTSFYIRKDIKDADINLESVEFYKLFSNDTLVIYAEVAEYDKGHITAETVTKIVNSLLYRTPAQSLNPHKGILTNELELFGNIPDVDNNGKLFVLLIDARDNYDPATSNTYVAGYFDPIDQMKSKGNYSDIIYIDTYPAKTTDDYTLGVVAHELQHLIHYNYDNNEKTWLNEGFSELAPILLGYTAHSFSKFLTNTNRKLTEFDGSLLDYSKVGLWSFYIYKRFGIKAIQEILRNQENGLASYESSLNNIGYSLSASDLLKEWFLANLVNDPNIEDGRYSYSGVEIPALQSEYFHANFTDGQVIKSFVKPQAAQYIQFNSGKNINLNLDVAKHLLASLALIRYKQVPEIEYVDISSGKYKMEDLNFGKDYKKLGLVLSWTSSVANSNQLDFSYSAVGVGGFEEIELSHDKDSLNFYISLDHTNVAAEKFQPTFDAELAAIKFNCGTTTPIDIKIYNSLDRNPIKIFPNVTSNYQEWTIFHLEETLPLSKDTPYYISIGSANSEKYSLGYAKTGEGKNFSFLSNGGNFYDLESFSIDDGESQLTGNWLIRSIVKYEIFKKPEMILKPDSLIFAKDEKLKYLEVGNIGTEVLEWQIASKPDFVNINQESGILSSGKVKLEITTDLQNKKAGLYRGDILVTTNANRDSTHIIAVKPNNQEAQTAFILPDNSFEKNQIYMKVFNIGVGKGNFTIKDFPPYLAIEPTEGEIFAKETLLVDLRIDSTLVNRRSFSFLFHDGINNIYQVMKYKKALNIDITPTFHLYDINPNPFIASRIAYANIMVYLSNNKKAKINIYNVVGKLVKTFEFDNYSEGLHLFHWNGKNNSGNLVSSGIYFIRLEQNGKSEIKKMVLLK